MYEKTKKRDAKCANVSIFIRIKSEKPSVSPREFVQTVIEQKQ